MKIKILSYNIHKGFNIGNRLFLLREMKQAIKEIGADIVFLQEVQGDHNHPKWRIENWNTAAQFEYLSDTIWDHYAYGKNAIYPAGHHGNAIMSRFPILSWNNFDLTINRFEYRGLLHAKIWLPEKKPLHLFNTHINLLESSRLKQADLITSYINKEVNDNEAFILGGDFNDWTNNVTTHLEKSLQIKESFTSLYSHLPKTFPSFFPLLSLDRILLKGANAVFATALKDGPWKQLSDHLPLLVEIEIN